MCWQPHAPNVLHCLLHAGKHHHETDWEQVRPAPEWHLNCFFGLDLSLPVVVLRYTCPLLLCLSLVFQTTGNWGFLNRFSCNWKCNCIQISSSFRQPANTKQCIQSAEDDFGWGLTLDTTWAAQLLANSNHFLPPSFYLLHWEYLSISFSQSSPLPVYLIRLSVYPTGRPSPEA